MRRLTRRAVLRHLDRLADDLTRRQLSRLQALAGLIGDDGRIPLPQALDAATPGGEDTKAQDAFRKFRAALDDAAQGAGVDLRLVSDQRKAPPPERFCWFEGADITGDEVAELSRREVDQQTADKSVPPFATEVLRVVYVETAMNASEAIRRLEREFVTLLTEQLSAVSGYRVTSALDTHLGVDLQAARRRLRETADVVVELDSAAAGRDEHPGSTVRRPITMALEGRPHGTDRTTDVVHCAGQPFSQCTNRTARLRFVGCVLELIHDRPRETVPPAGPALPDSVARRLADRRILDGEPVPPRAGVISLASDALTEPGPRRLGEMVLAVDRLREWATDSSETARRLCALLGDVGMGKTTTIRLFTQELLALREEDRSVPLPILFDLRDLPLAVVRAGAGLPAILAALLEQGDLGAGLSAEQVLDLVAGGDCVLIFDGLDEVLVHLDPHAGQVFTRTLWRATEDTRHPRPTERPPARPSKLLLSCRTHYFRTIRHETTHFTGQHRDGPATADYLALIMLPFNEEQVRAYLTANLPGTDVERLLELIDSVHNLREIAERPLTLRMITEQLETLEQAKFAGRTVRAVDLYASFVSQWLERDHGKHCLLPEHKELLMEHLAAELWRSGRTAWGVGDVEQWLLEFLHGRPDLELHYPARVPDLWKEDLRTATFLVRRDDDTFGFAHTSLREYFLARSLGRALELPPEQVRERWQLPVPSRETLDFLGQWLAGRDAAGRARGTAALAALAAHTPAGRADGAAVLAFAYSLAADCGGHPSHAPAGSRLAGADLTGWWIDGGDCRLDLRGLSLTGADLTGAVLRDVDLSGANLGGADLTRAELHDSDLSRADLRRADLTGTVFRHCDLTGTRWSESTAYQTQALWCRPAQERRQGWLMAPANAAPPPDAMMSAFTGHTDWVTGGGWSPDGTRLLTTSWDSTARIWDAATGRHHLTLTGHTDRVTGGGWSPDGTRLLTTSDDGTARIWDAATGRHHLTLTGHTNRVTGGGWSPDGTRLLTTSWDSTARIWDAATGRHHLTLTGHTGSLTGGGWSPDGTRLLTTSDDGTARIWDAATGRHHLTLTGHTGSLTGGGWSPDGTRLLTTSHDGTARIWDAATGRHHLTLTGHTGSLTGGGWSPDGTRLLTTSHDRTARIWDAATGRHHLTLTGHTDPLTGGGWSPDGTRLLTTSHDRTARIWDAATGRHHLTLTGHTDPLTGGGWSPDGTRLLTTSHDGTARIWDAATGRHHLTLTGHTDRVTGGGWSPDGTRLLTTSWDSTARIWDAATGRHHLTLTGHTDPLTGGGWSPDGTRLLTTSDDGTARIWDAATGRHHLTLTGHTDPLTGGGWSPDGTRLLTTSDDGTARIWDAATGRHHLTLTGHTDRVTGGGWSPDGTRLLTTSWDSTARIWDAATGRHHLTLTGHTDRVTGGGWSPDGTRLLTTSDDGTARIWDAATGRHHLTLTGHTNPLTSGSWSPDGTRLLTTSNDHTAQIWDAATGQLVGWQLEQLPGSELAVWSSPEHELLGASDGAWRWLGWLVPQDGRLVRLPAETWGPLPPLDPPVTAPL